MSGAQVWTLIVGTLTVQVGIISAMLGVQSRWMRAEFGRIDDRLEKLDRDVHAVIVRMMGDS